MEQTETVTARQIWAALSTAEKRRIKAAAALAGKSEQEWNREAVLEKLGREQGDGPEHAA